MTTDFGLVFIMLKSKKEVIPNRKIFSLPST